MHRNVPNAISFARLVLAPFLAVAAALNHLGAFRWILLVCLASDILDGWVARRFDLRSKLGARLDSIADLLVELAALFGLWVFHAEVVREHATIIACALGLYFGQMAFALWRYHKVSSFHTVINRIGAYAQGIFLITLFFWQYSAPLFYAAICLVMLASIEEIVIVSLLSEWTADVGGLWRMRKKHRALPR